MYVGVKFEMCYFVIQAREKSREYFKEYCKCSPEYMCCHVTSQASISEAVFGKGMIDDYL